MEKASINIEIMQDDDNYNIRVNTKADGIAQLQFYGIAAYIISVSKEANWSVDDIIAEVKKNCDDIKLKVNPYLSFFI